MCISNKCHHHFGSRGAVCWPPWLSTCPQDPWQSPSIPSLSLHCWVTRQCFQQQGTHHGWVEIFRNQMSARRGKGVSQVFVSFLPHPLPCPPWTKCSVSGNSEPGVLLGHRQQGATVLHEVNKSSSSMVESLQSPQVAGQVKLRNLEPFSLDMSFKTSLYHGLSISTRDRLRVNSSHWVQLSQHFLQ